MSTSAVQRLRADILSLSSQFQAVISTLTRVAVGLSQLENMQLQKEENAIMKKDEVSVSTEIRNNSQAKQLGEKKKEAKKDQPRKIPMWKPASRIRIPEKGERSNDKIDEGSDQYKGTLSSGAITPAPPPRAYQIIAKDIKQTENEEMKRKKITRRSSWSYSQKSNATQGFRAQPVAPVLRIDRRIKMNIGGKIFITSQSTLDREPSMFTSMISSGLPTLNFKV